MATDEPQTPKVGSSRSGARPLAELRSSGLLWLINRAVFHPRGFALSLVLKDGEVEAWQLLGDGSEVWFFEGNEDTDFARAEETLRRAKVPAERELR